MPRECVSALLDRVIEAFAGPSLAHRALWERLEDTSAIHDADGWRRISEMLPDAPVTMLIDDADGVSGVEISRGKLVAEVLSRTVGFVFYVVSPRLEYLICFNDHDLLIGAGAAKAWIESLKDTRPDGLEE